MAYANHAQCEACWIERETLMDDDGNVVVRRPVRLTEPSGQVCCYCGKLTIMGIFRRDKIEDLPQCTHTAVND